MSRSGLREIDWSEVVLDLRRVQAGVGFPSGSGKSADARAILSWAAMREAVS